MKNSNFGQSYLLAFIFLMIIFDPAVSIAQKISIYASPHPDDWQLFMNPHAWHGIKNENEKVIFLHITAGDEGNGTGNNSYYLAREEGSLRAIRFMSNTFTSGAGLGNYMNPTKITINGHSIQKFTYRNAVSFFLRLPDGGIDGNGYATTGNVSLAKLYNGTISSISTIDVSTKYTSLNDLKETIKSIILSEANSSTELEFNVADTDKSVNPGDHPDHYNSSYIVQDVANEIGSCTINSYQGYTTGGKSQNVFGHDYLVSAGTWGATSSGLSDMLHWSSWDDGHNPFVGKQYFRTIITGGQAPYPEINIALNKPTTCSSHEGNRVSSFAVDGIISTNNWWGANPYSQWWQVDLLDTYVLNKIKMINYYDGSRFYKYDINVSLDGKNWTKVVDFNNNTTPATSQGNIFNINNVKARYIRVNMNYNSANVGVHIVEFLTFGELELLNNIALSKPTTCSSHEGNRVSSFAVDGIISTNNWWGANPYPQWWQVDLLDTYALNKIKMINYYDGSRFYKYDINVSLDGKNWTKVVDFNNNTTPAANTGNTFFVNNEARYIRVNMNYNSANVGVHIIEFEAFGTSTSSNARIDQSDIISDLKEERYFVNVFPNPLSEGRSIKLLIELPSKENIKIDLYSLKGEKIESKEYNLDAGRNEIEFSTLRLTKGLFYFVINSKGRQEFKKVVKL